MDDWNEGTSLTSPSPGGGFKRGMAQFCGSGKASFGGIDPQNGRKAATTLFLTDWF